MFDEEKMMEYVRENGYEIQYIPMVKIPVNNQCHELLPLSEAVDKIRSRNVLGNRTLRKMGF